MRTLALAAILIVIAPCTVAAPTDISKANEVLKGCAATLSGEQGMHAGICIGTVEALRFVGDSLKSAFSICVPDDVSQGDVVRAVIEWAQQNPKVLDTEFIGVAAFALHEKWPCK